MYPAPRATFAPYRNYLLAAAALFAVGIILGAQAVAQFPDLIEKFLNTMEDELKRLMDNVFLDGAIMGILRLFFHNFRAMILIVSLGFVLGLYPVFAMVVNGLIIGVVGAMFTEATSLAAFLAGIIPHGILEIPAILIAAAIGLRFGLGPLLNKEKGDGVPGPTVWRGYKAEFKSSLKLLALSTGLLVFAAIIELTVTPIFIGFFAG